MKEKFKQYPNFKYFVEQTNLKSDDLLKILKISYPAYYRKCCRDGNFSLKEAQALSNYFEIPINILFNKNLVNNDLLKEQINKFKKEKSIYLLKKENSYKII